MRYNKTFLALLMVLFALIALAACAPDREEGGNADNTGGEEDEAEKPESLTVWANDEENQLAAIENAAAAYEEETDIEVEIVAKSMLDQLDELALAGPEGKGPDLFFQPHDMTGDIVAQGLAQPLSLTDEDIEPYSDASIESVQYEFEGETSIYGIPAVIETYGIFYNKDIIDEPTTVDDLITALEEHTNPSEDEYGFLMKPNDLYFSYPFFKTKGAYIFGGEPGAYDVNDIGLANDAAIEAGELYQSFFDEGMIPASTTVDVIDGLFTEGTIGAVINGPWSISSYTEALGDSLGFTSFPSIDGEEAQTLVGVKAWMVSYYSEKADWATDLALFLTNEENGQNYFEEAGELPTNNVALENLDDPIFEEFSAQIENGVPMPSTPQMSQVWEPMNNALQFMAEGEDPASVLPEAVEQIEANIEASGGAE
ncbi:sugar ABC transporter substrate-binding protein [Gracilibacillus phocaeensis]|uniref:sugar ABC transporter substrate-binding protein n=1 Tax=Gracilibacillus phocaeensis TaxID=2042304 RepID=UPI00102F9EAB|nr:extracellular solute-binding protein [Gracilibacillus phocaeensis]